MNVRHDANFGLVDKVGVRVRLDHDSELSGRERDSRTDRVDAHAIDESLHEYGVIAPSGELVQECERFIGKILSLVETLCRHCVESIDDGRDTGIETLPG